MNKWPTNFISPAALSLNTKKVTGEFGGRFILTEAIEYLNEIESLLVALEDSQEPFTEAMRIDMAGTLVGLGGGLQLQSPDPTVDPQAYLHFMGDPALPDVANVQIGTDENEDLRIEALTENVNFNFDLGGGQLMVNEAADEEDPKMVAEFDKGERGDDLLQHLQLVNRNTIGGAGSGNAARFAVIDSGDPDHLVRINPGRVYLNAQDEMGFIFDSIDEEALADEVTNGLTKDIRDPFVPGNGGGRLGSTDYVEGDQVYLLLMRNTDTGRLDMGFGDNVNDVGPAHRAVGVLHSFIMAAGDVIPHFIQIGNEIFVDEPTTSTVTDAAILTSLGISDRARRIYGVYNFKDGDVTGISNLVIRSNELTNAQWLQTNLTSVLQNVEDPLGTANNAFSVTETNALGQHTLRNNNNVATVIGTRYVMSLYVKPQLRDHVNVVVFESGGSHQANFDIGNRDLQSSLSIIAGSERYSDAGNGWIRISFAFDSLATGNITGVEFQMNINGSSSYTGDNSQVAMEFCFVQMDTAASLVEPRPYVAAVAATVSGQTVNTSNGTNRELIINNFIEGGYSDGPQASATETLVKPDSANENPGSGFMKVDKSGVPNLPGLRFNTNVLQKPLISEFQLIGYKRTGLQ